jgi:DMSO reductase anchor subunit
MRPTWSIIVFTCLSGAGYGVWFLIGAGIALDVYPYGRGSVLVPLAWGLILTSAGLLASLAHLGKPLRAWRALSQWRSSWLSREGVASLACVPLVLVLAATDDKPHHAPLLRIGFGLLAVLAAVTVYCTSRIYSSLATVRAWRDPRTGLVYTLLALETGGLWLWTARSRHGLADAADWGWLAGLMLVVVAGTWVMHAYWRAIARLPAPCTGDATGLGHLGRVRAAEAPHTEENYLLREMGYVLARRRAASLRTLTRYLLVLVPLFALAGAALAPPLAPILAPLAALAAMAGALLQRWLFFAEARHAVTGYYNVMPDTTS